MAPEKSNLRKLRFDIGELGAKHSKSKKSDINIGELEVKKFKLKKTSKLQFNNTNNLIAQSQKSHRRKSRGELGKSIVILTQQRE